MKLLYHTSITRKQSKDTIMMQKYDITANIIPDLSENEITALTMKIKDFVISLGGEIISDSVPVKKALGYQLKHKKAAYLFSGVFALEKEKISEVHKELKKEQSILRFMINKSRKPKKENTRAIRKKPIVSPSADIQNDISLKSESKKAEIKEIDKKIEEILSE